MATGGVLITDVCDNVYKRLYVRVQFYSIVKRSKMMKKLCKIF